MSAKKNPGGRPAKYKGECVRKILYGPRRAWDAIDAMRAQDGQSRMEFILANLGLEDLDADPTLADYYDVTEDENDNQ